MPHNERKWPHPDSWPGSGPEELTGQLRSFAAQVVNVHRLFQSAGFTDDQAFALMMLILSQQQWHQE